MQEDQVASSALDEFLELWGVMCLSHVQQYQNFRTWIDGFQKQCKHDLHALRDSLTQLDASFQVG